MCLIFYLDLTINFSLSFNSCTFRWTQRRRQHVTARLGWASSLQLGFFHIEIVLLELCVLSHISSELHICRSSAKVVLPSVFLWKLLTLFTLKGLARPRSIYPVQQRVTPMCASFSPSAAESRKLAQTCMSRGESFQKIWYGASWLTPPRGEDTRWKGKERAS